MLLVLVPTVLVLERRAQKKRRKEEEWSGKSKLPKWVGPREWKAELDAKEREIVEIGSSGPQPSELPACELFPELDASIDRINEVNQQTRR